MEPPSDLPPSFDALTPPRRIDIARLAEAFEASWDHLTAYQGATRQNNPAYGQCYPTARVVQWFYPEVEIACGDVWTGRGSERHFWNIRGSGAGRACLV